METVRMRSWKLSLILLAASLAGTAISWMIGLPFFFLFLVVPLIPFLSRRQVRRCPVCGWETTGSERFCPFDATPLTGCDSRSGDRQD
jgi:hypothetical protein